MSAAALTLVADERPQNLVALERANEIRFARARFKRKVYAMPGPQSREHLATVIARQLVERDEWLDGAKVYVVLQYARRLGPGKAKQTLRVIEASEQQTIGGLTRRQLQLLAACILNGPENVDPACPPRFSVAVLAAEAQAA
jgi:hypothetical protein